jgi:Zn-dependent peptidase ImmA (M78 family)
LLGISVVELKAYEIGDLNVTMGAFENFSTKYRLPQATLFSLTPPDEPPKPKDFRTIEGKKPQQSFDFGVALSNVRTWVSQYKRIASEDEEFELPTLPVVALHEKPEAIGERERKRLGISPQAQLSWPQNEAFRRWRASLEARGVIVFQQKFSMTDCKGFTLYESESTPTIIINKTEQTETAKIFTIAHEYCHLLLRQPGISNENFDDPVESFCNKFAAAFLIPSDLLRLLLPYWPNQAVNWGQEEINTWATRIKVSRVALALRLEQLGLAPDGFHVRFKRKKRLISAPARPQRKFKPDPTVVHLSDIGGAYTKTIIGAMDRKIIDETHAAEALGVSVRNFDKARRAIKRHGELSVSG